MSGDVGEAVGATLAVAEAAQVGRDHVEAGGGERVDVAPPDAARLRPAVDQQQRRAAHSLVRVGDLEAARRRAVIRGSGLGEVAQRAHARELTATLARRVGRRAASCPAARRRAVPGPRSRALAARLARVESRNVTCVLPAPPIFWERALGANVWDVDGNRYVDLGAGFGVANVGHAHPRVVDAVAEQAQRAAARDGRRAPGGGQGRAARGAGAALPGRRAGARDARQLRAPTPSRPR